MKKIFAIFPSFYFDHSKVKVGGGEISNKIILKRLSKDYSIFIICATGDMGWRENKEGIVYYNLQALLGKIIFLNVLNIFFSKFLLKFISLILCYYLKPEFIFSGTYTVGYGNLYKKINKNVKTLAFVRAFEHFENELDKKNNFRNKLKKMLYGDYGLKQLNKLDHVVVNSKFMKNFYVEKGLKSPISIIYPSVSLDQLTLNKIDKIQNIAMVGDAFHKGIGVFKQLSKIYPELDFHVIGANVQFLKIEGNIHYHPWQSNPEILMSKMDLFIVPSEWSEPFGRVSVEALRSGNRVLVSSKGGLPETVDFNDELIIQNNNINEWQNKIMNLLIDPNCYNDIYNRLHHRNQIYTSNYQQDVVVSLLKKMS